MNRKGVKTTKEKYGKNYFKEIRKLRKAPSYFADPEVARKAAQKRWAQVKKDNEVRTDTLKEV